MRFAPAGSLFDVQGSSGFGATTDTNLALTALLNSVVGNVFLSFINPTLSFQTGNVAKVPVHDNVFDEMAFRLAEDCILVSKTDWNQRESSFEFLGLSWLTLGRNIVSSFSQFRTQLIELFFQLHKNEEGLNRIFIDVYGLHDELTPEVPLKDITILQEELDSDDLEALEDEFRAGGGQPRYLTLLPLVIPRLVSRSFGLKRVSIRG